jgi:hypothetical protein
MPDGRLVRDEKDLDIPSAKQWLVPKEVSLREARERLCRRRVNSRSLQGIYRGRVSIIMRYVKLQEHYVCLQSKNGPLRKQVVPTSTHDLATICKP